MYTPGETVSRGKGKGKGGKGGRKAEVVEATAGTDRIKAWKRTLLNLIKESRANIIKVQGDEFAAGICEKMTEALQELEKLYTNMNVLTGKPFAMAQVKSKKTSKQTRNEGKKKTERKKQAKKEGKKHTNKQAKKRKKQTSKQTRQRTNDI